MSSILFQIRKIKVMEWSDQYVELNPIENLWDDIHNGVSGAKPRKAGQLWKVVKSVWFGIPVYWCQKLVNRM